MKMKGAKIALTAFTSLALLLAGCGGGAETSNTPANNGSQTGSGSETPSAETFTIRAVSAWPETNELASPIFMFQEKLEEKSEGRLKIEYLGGPEVVPAADQAEAVKNGIADMALTTGSYYASQMPEAYVLDFSEMTPQEERENGGFEFLQQLHEQKVGVTYIGRAPGREYALYTVDEVKTSADFNGKMMRATGVYIPLLEALGAQYTNIPGGEIYSALERNIVEGVAWPELGTTDFSLQDHLRYKVKPTFWQTGTSFVMNTSVWNELPDDLKEIVLEVAVEVEQENPGVMKEVIEAEDKVLIEAGVQIVTLEDADQYTQTANDSAWNWFKGIANENYDKLAELFRK